MSSGILSRRPALTAVLMAGGALLVLTFMWDTESTASQLLEMDLRFLALPLAAGGFLLAIGKLALWLRDREPVKRVTWRVMTRNGSVLRLPLTTVLGVTHRLLVDLGWTALGLGLLSAVPEFPRVISAQPWGPDIADLGGYLASFGALAIVGGFLLSPFIVVRATAEVRPRIGEIVGFPGIRLAAFGVAFILLANNGILKAVFGMDSSALLLGLWIALVFSVAATVLRRFLSNVRQDNPHRPGMVALYVIEAVWIIALLGAMAALPYAVEGTLSGAEPQDGGTLNPSYLLFLSPFVLILCAGVFRPALTDLLGVPVVYMSVLAVLYVTFSGNGVLPTVFSVDISELFSALIAATVLFYTALILRNVPKITMPERYALLVANTSRALSVLTLAGAVTLVVTVGLAHLPVANAILLDHGETRRVGRALLPLLGSIYDIRYSISLVSFMATVTLFLPSTLDGHTFQRYRPIVSALGYFAVGCLTWLTAVSLSGLGHGFAFGGAIIAAGMFSVALTRLAQYVAVPSASSVADIADWLAASRLRCFVLGGAVAFYVLLLRPVLYEVLWFAALYEYVALLLLLFAVLMNVVNRLRVVANAPDVAEPAWADWSHHQQVLESKPDPRAELTDTMRQRYIDGGDWRPLWTYLFGLLYRNGASIDVMAAVCYSLRHGAAAPPLGGIFGRGAFRRKRITALEHVLDTAGRAPTSLMTHREYLGENDLRAAVASFTETGANPDVLSVALAVVHCQRGAEPEDAVDRLSSLIDTTDSFLGRLARRFSRSNTGARARMRRLNLVDATIGALFTDAHELPPRRSSISGH